VRLHLTRVDLNYAIKSGIPIAGKGLPVSQRFFPLRTLRRKRASFHISEGSLVRSDHPCSRSRFDAHVAERHPAFHRQRPHSFSSVFNHVSRCAISTDGANDSERKVFRSHAFRKRSSYFNEHCSRLVLRQTLSGQHVFDLAGANAERQRSKCSVRTCMTVATDNRHSRLGQSQLRPDDVYDSLFRGIDIKQTNVELFAVPAEGINLFGSYGICDRHAAVGGGRCRHTLHTVGRLRERRGPPAAAPAAPRRPR